MSSHELECEALRGCGFHSFNGQIDVFYSRAFVPDSFGKLEESSAKRAKLCPPARRPHFSGKQPVSHADLVSRPRGDSNSALGVPFGGVLVENRLGGEIFSKFSLASLGSACLGLSAMLDSDGRRRPAGDRVGAAGRPGRHQTARSSENSEPGAAPPAAPGAAPPPAPPAAPGASGTYGRIQMPLS